MITLTFGKIDKKPNSTKRTMTDTMEVSACLKENVDIKAPVFKVNFDPSSYNYVAWGDRYYYIDNTVYSKRNLFEVHCSLDLLATYRDILPGSPCCLKYSTLDFNYRIDDMRFTPQVIQNTVNGLYTNTDPEYSSVDLDSLSMFDFTDGAFIISCISNGTIGGSGAGMHTWVLSLAEYNTFMKNLYSFWTGGPFQSVSERVEAIKSCIWVPFKRSSLRGVCAQADLEIAGQTLVSNTYYYSSPQPLFFNEATLHAPQFDSTKAPLFMRGSRWNNYQLITPGGVTPIDADMLLATTDITVHIDIDGKDGTANFKFFLKPPTSTKTFANNLLYETTINYAVDLYYTFARMRDFKDDVKTAIGMGASIAAGAFTGGMSLGAGAAVAKVTEASNNLVDLQEAGSGATTGDIKDAKQALRTAQTNAANANQKASLGKVGTAGLAVATKMLHSPSMPNINITRSNNLASVYGTNAQKIIISRKQYVCPELNSNTSDTSDTALAKYRRYCLKFGFPVSGELTEFPSITANPQFYSVECIQLSTGSIVGNLDADEVIALENICKHGIWMEQ